MSAPADPAAVTPPKLLQITADRAIALARRWMRLSVAINALMIVAVITASVIGFRSGVGSLPAFVAAMIWFAVLVVSVPARRLAIDAAPLIAAGELTLAEDRLSQSLRSFSIVRSTRLLGLQQLALLRHSQSNWADVAKLCRELIAQQRPGERDVDLSSRLMLAEALVELGELPAAAQEIAFLSAQRLNLRETLVLSALRIETQVRGGAWELAMAQPEAQLAMIELMPPLPAARCHALLALAARRLGFDAWHGYLARRALLLADPGTITKGRPFLREAFEGIEGGGESAVEAGIKSI